MPINPPPLLEMTKKKGWIRMRIKMSEERRGGIISIGMYRGVKKGKR
jgi:hypothetical protein